MPVKSAKRGLYASALAELRECQIARSRELQEVLEGYVGLASLNARDIARIEVCLRGESLDRQPKLLTPSP